ncbi:hypothetical protein HDU98_003380 [Podochytrium sp. JEL0797]|nr:hypothetical protein HDU98_003380 [Podochytrium sp. JEL0797]
MTDEIKPTMKRTIVIAVDNSQYSEKALQWAIAQYLRPGDFVVLVNVVKHEFPAPNGSDNYLGKMDEMKKRESVHLLETLGKELQEAHVAFETVSMVGGPRDSILHKIQEVDASCVIIGSRGGNLVSRSLIGSTSDYLAHHAPCPVIIAKPSLEQLHTMNVPAHHKTVHDFLPFANGLAMNHLTL